jgi:hypothetical protein
MSLCLELKKFDFQGVLGHGFCVVPSRIYHEVWVADFAWFEVEKSAPERAFWVRSCSRRRVSGCRGERLDVTELRQ